MATGTSVIGYQRLFNVPYTANRIFIELATAFPLEIFYKGNISVEYDYQANNYIYVAQSKPFWRQGLMFYDLPSVSTPPEPVLAVIANWRLAGLNWHLDYE